MYATMSGSLCLFLSSCFLLYAARRRSCHSTGASRLVWHLSCSKSVFVKCSSDSSSGGDKKSGAEIFISLSTRSPTHSIANARRLCRAPDGLFPFSRFAPLGGLYQRCRIPGSSSLTVRLVRAYWTSGSE